MVTVIDNRYIDHELKIIPEFFSPLLFQDKNFELRKNDRDFKVGDKLKLNEWNPETKEYTSRYAYKTITYILQGGVYGLAPDYCILSLM